VRELSSVAAGLQATFKGPTYKGIAEGRDAEGTEGQTGRKGCKGTKRAGRQLSSVPYAYFWVRYCTVEQYKVVL